MADRKDVADGPGEIIEEARKAYERAREAWHDNQEEARKDLRFARLREQWPDKVRKQRENDNRPCLTLDHLGPVIRQVVNDARQNRPSIKVHPQDDAADVQVAEIINGLIRNIETASDADVAYDTAIEHSVGQGFGFWRINTKYTSDDTFDQDIVIERISNPFTVYGDPRSTTADSSDWNVAFVTSTLTKDEFEAEYPDAEKIDWSTDYRDCPDWISADSVTVSEYWTREKVKGAIVALSDGSILQAEEYQEHADELTTLGLTLVGEPRETETYKVTQRIISGAEVLKEVSWAGKYIPIVIVYGDEVVDEDGKRHFRSLIRDAKEAQQNLNYWRSITTELVALAPKAPYIGEERAFEIDPNWAKANEVSFPYLMVPTGVQLPQRQPFTGVPAGAMQEALSATDDIKAITGIYDASLGARSNETSGRAIMARQREGDVSTFHFIDNLSRSIRHGGRILLDLIPKVYTTQRMIRVLGQDKVARNVQIAPTGQSVQPQLAQPSPQDVQAAAANNQPAPEPQIIGHIFDITAGKYDLTVEAGPSYTTQREEAVDVLSNLMSQVPGAAPVLGPHLVRMMDMPDSQEISEELKMLSPAYQAQQQQAQQAQQQGQVPPELQQQMQQQQETIQQGTQLLQQLQQQLAAAQAALKDKGAEAQIAAQKNQIDQFRAETERLRAQHDIEKAAHLIVPPQQMPVPQPQYQQPPFNHSDLGQ